MLDSFDPYYQWLGIPAKDQPPSHYRLLGLEAFEANRDVIEHAADRQMLHLRTFAMGRHADVSQRLLNELAAAKLCLLTDEKKRSYDAELRSRQATSSLPVAVCVPHPEPVGASTLPVWQPSPAAESEFARPTVALRAAADPLRTTNALRGARQPGTGSRVLALIGGGAVLALLVGLVAWLTGGGADQEHPAADRIAPARSTVPPAEETSTTHADQASNVEEAPADSMPMTAENDVDVADSDGNLLAQVDPQRDGRGGAWRREGTDLVVEPGFTCRLALPGAPPAEYTLRVELTPEIHQPQSCLLIVAPVLHGRQLMVAFDWGDQTGLHYLDGQDRAFNETTRKVQALVERQPVVLEFEVTQQGLEVRRDGELLAEWHDAVDRFSLLNWAVPETDRILLGAHGGQYRFTRVQIVRHGE